MVDNKKVSRHMISLAGDEGYLRLKQEAKLRGITIGQVIENYIKKSDETQYSELKKIHMKIMLEFSYLKGEEHISDQTKELFDILWYYIYNMFIGVFDEAEFIKILSDNIKEVRSENQSE
jgi:hypothetical protein